MFLSRCLPALFILLLLGGGPADAADGVDLSGTFDGFYIDKGRTNRRKNLRLRIRHRGEQLQADAADNTMWITGLVVEDRVFVEWEHASGERGEGIWNILDSGNRLEGTWTSAGSSSFFGVWEFTRR